MSALFDANPNAGVPAMDAAVGASVLRQRSSVRRWLVAILAAVLATGMRQALQPVLHDALTFVFAYPAVVLIALRQGFGPAMLTAALCGIGGALTVSGRAVAMVDLPVRIGLFAVASIVIALACSQSGGARRRLATPASAKTACVDTPLTRWLQAVIWGAALIPLTLFATACWWGRDTALAAGQERVTRANLVTLRHAERTFQTAIEVASKARSLAALTDAQLRASEPEIRQRLQDMLIGLSVAQAIMVWDASGKLVLGTAVSGNGPFASIEDRSYFQQARAGDDAVFFTDLIRGRITGKTVLNAVARRTAADGSFAGAVVVALYPGYFQQFYQSLASEDDGPLTFAMFRTDGSILARWPPPPRDDMRLPDDSRLTRAAQTGETEGMVRVRSQFDGQPRMISFMRVHGTPVFASAALLESAVFEPWHRFMLLLAAVLGPVTIGLVYVSWVALKKTQREQIVLLELQAEMRRRAQTEKALAQAQRLEALSVLTGGVAHDFNNLLAIVNGNIHMIRRLHAEVGNGRHLTAIARAVASGVRLTRQLLSFARRQALKPEQIALQGWLPGMADLLKSTLGNGIALDIQVAPGIGSIHVDAGELELALINLATNARDAMAQRGSLWVTANDTTGSDGRAMVVIRVRDAGCGIAPELLTKVFEPFFTTKPPNKGTGLGLSQVYGFCLQAGGAAGVESAPGHGTTVSMTLPAAVHADLPPPAEAAGQAEARLSGTVLLVEDNPDVATAHRELLESAGLGVRCVASADEALAAATGTDDRPQLVLSDIAMPGPMDGIQLAFRLREQCPGLPVVLLTGYASRVQEAADAGFRVLGKPVEPDRLIAAIDDALRSARPPQEGVVRQPAEASPVSAQALERA